MLGAQNSLGLVYEVECAISIISFTLDYIPITDIYIRVLPILNPLGLYQS